MSDVDGGRSMTVEDVAARAGVSVATVSRALRGLPNVAPATRDRVVAAAEALRYRPDPNASRLATGRSHAIGMAVPVLGQWYFGQVLAGVDAALGPAGYDLLVYGGADPDSRRRFLGDALGVGKRVDGIILVDFALPDADVVAWAASGVVVVTVGQRTGPFSSVTVDDRAAAALAVEHLVALGHRRIAMVGTQDDRGGFRFVVPEQRRAGYRDVLDRHGLPHDPALEIPSDFTVDGGRRGTDCLLRLASPPTAVFAASDEMAVGALRSAREHGLAVPDDLSIVGFDDHDVAGAVGLTTVRQPVLDIGARAALLLLDRLGDPRRAPEHDEVAVELVVRTTTAAVRGPMGQH